MGQPAVPAPIPAPVYGPGGGPGVVPQHMYEIPVQGLARAGDGSAANPYTGWSASVAAAAGAFVFSEHCYALDASVGQLLLKNGTHLRGMSRGGSQIVAPTGYRGHGIRAVGPVNGSTSGDIIIENLNVVCLDAANANASSHSKGIEINALSYCRVTGVSVSGWNRQIVFDQTENCTIDGQCIVSITATSCLNVADSIYTDPLAITQHGVGGAAVWGYQAVPVRSDGAVGRPCRAVTTGGNVTLSASNYNILAITQQGSASSSFSKSGDVITYTAAGRLTDLWAPFTSDMVGWTITVAGATTPGNNGDFVITSVVSATVVTYVNASGATEAGAGTWVLKPDHHDIYRSASPDGTGVGKIGNTTSSTFNDTGNALLPADGTLAPWVNCGLWIVNGSDNTPGASGDFSNAIRINDCEFNDGTGQGIHVIDDGGDGHLYSDNTFNGGLVAYWFAGNSMLHVRGGYAESQTLGAIWFDWHSFTVGGSTAGCSNVTLMGLIVTGAVFSVSIKSMGNLSVQGCTLLAGLHSAAIGGGANAVTIYDIGGNYCGADVLVDPASLPSGGILRLQADPTVANQLEVKSTAGALSLTVTSMLQVSGTMAFTLANGTYSGQKKRIKCYTAASTPHATVTPATPVGFSSIVLTATTDWVDLEWCGAWAITAYAGAGVTINP